MDAAVRYWAFLSYSHRDRRVAERLHRALETYRIPRRLVGRNGPLGLVPARLTPIFRDRDELTATKHLGAAVEAALAASGAMIVLCSRASAQSRWVDAEVIAFERNHPDRPLLCVLVDGEPQASSDPATTGNECLPSALRARFDSAVGVADTAPVAVDLRPQGDGWRLGVQKLVASLAGLPLDQLVQRDTHRRHRRMAWLSAALAVLALVLGTMAVFAVRARNEAQTQRTQAEGLIEFMLGDLRQKLEPVGRLDVLDAVGVRALRYYDAQQIRALDADSLGRRARSLQLIGEIDAKRGDMDKALNAFRRASDSTAELLARTPNDPQRMFEHAQSVFFVGQYDWQHGNVDAAEKSMQEYLRLANRMVAIDPGNMKWLAEVGYAHSTLGAMQMGKSQPQAALVEFTASRRVNDRLLAADPGNDTLLLQGLTQDLSWMSSAHAAALQFDESARLRREEIGHYKSLLARDPRNAVATERLMYAQQMLANLDLDRGDLADSAAANAEAARLLQAQLRLDPDNTDWRQADARNRILQARLLGWQGRPEAGLDEIARVRTTVAGLLARDAEVWDWRVMLQESLAQAEVELLRQLSRREPAMRIAETSLQRLQRVMAKPEYTDKTRKFLAQAAGQVATLRDEAGDRDAAETAWRTVSQALTAHESELDAQSLAWLARARNALGDRAGMARIDARLRAAGYRHPGYVTTAGESGRSLPVARQSALTRRSQ